MACDLLEIDDSLIDRGLDARADRQHDPNPVRIVRGDEQAQEPADRGAHHGVQPAHAKVVEQLDLRIDDVAHPQDGKRGSPVACPSRG